MTSLQSLPFAFARRSGLVLITLTDEEACLGVTDWCGELALLEARRALGRPLKLVEIDRVEFERRLSAAYALDPISSKDEAFDPASDLAGLASELPEAAELLDSDDDAPVIRLINGVIAEAYRRGASDIHVEPFESALIVRIRVDGLLRELLQLDPRFGSAVVSRVKVMARLDIAERRIPQDGRITVLVGGRAVDVRVSTLPSRSGERVVLRILDKDQELLDLDRLGMPKQVRAAVDRALREPNGVVLVTGPTGSGKTTTLYAALSALNSGDRNILTIEDPIEYAIDGIGQSQVNPKVGMTFAAGLRAILRQDPDIVMVGEIRDPETAQIAVQASLTGHLVLSTVHTNDAVGAITRLRDMGVEPFLLASTLRVVVAQRLVRRLCEHCRVPVAVQEIPRGRSNSPVVRKMFRAAGCPDCDNSGYSGRVGLYEALNVDDIVRRLIAEEAAEDDIAAAAFSGSRRLADHARQCVESGVTTLEEAIRVAREESVEDAAV